jgi:diguanylate cyclase (GGDEF)-like protein
MPGAVSWITVVRDWWLRRARSRLGSDVGIVHGYGRRVWLLNMALFVALTVPTLLIGTAGWPLRVAAAAGLIGACAWEGVALRLRRFPVWADALETAAIAVVAWRYPTGTGGLVFVLAFALPALGFRMIYSTTVQAAARTLSVLAAIYVGSMDPSAPTRRLPVVALVVVVVAFLLAEVTGLVRRRAALMLRGRVADQLSGDLASAKGRKDVYAAMLRAVLELLHGRTDARAIVWDEPDSLRPTAAAGANSGEVHAAGGEPLSVVPWVREAIEAGESTYRESVQVDELRSALDFDPIPGVVFIVPLRHREQIRALSVCAMGPIPPEVRADIEYVARVGEVALGSIELTREGLQGLRERSYHDPGTRLANRELLRQRLEQALEEPDRLVAVLLIRLDRFRTIGDSLGNMAGGDAVVTLTARLEASVPPQGTLARFGSDEFAVLLDGLTDPAAAEQIAVRILAVLDEPLPGLLGSGTGVFVRGCVGVALSGPDARTAIDLLRNADVAVHVASTTEGESCRVFDPGMRASIVDRLELESDLSRALDNDEFVLHYQPVVHLQAWEWVSGVEALIRWNRPRHGMVSPAEFIPAAEETGLITQIGAWALREGCRQQHDWAATEPELARLTVSVNLSAVQLAHADVKRMIGNTIAETGADPTRMIVEITESALVENTAANLEKLRTIRALGVRLALDDFGTGFSSLGYLRQFPFDSIKIDHSFVREVDVDEGAAALASSVVGMGRALNLTSLAEGVETFAQADWLTKAGCDAAQGYFFAPPMPPDQLVPMLTNGLSLPSVRDETAPG